MSLWHCECHGLHGPMAQCPKASRAEVEGGERAPAPSSPVRAHAGNYPWALYDTQDRCWLGDQAGVLLYTPDLIRSRLAPEVRVLHDAESCYQIMRIIEHAADDQLSPVSDDLVKRRSVIRPLRVRACAYDGTGDTYKDEIPLLRSMKEIAVLSESLGNLASDLLVLKAASETVTAENHAAKLARLEVLMTHQPEVPNGTVEATELCALADSIGRYEKWVYPIGPQEPEVWALEQAAFGPTTLVLAFVDKADAEARAGLLGATVVPFVRQLKGE